MRTEKGGAKKISKTLCILKFLRKITFNFLNAQQEHNGFIFHARRASFSELHMSQRSLNDKSSFVAALLRPKTAGAAGRSQKWQTGWGLDYESVHTPMIGSGTHSLTMEIPLLCPLILLRRENGLQPLACGDHVGANKSDSWPEGSRFRCRDKPTFRRRSKASASRS